MLLSPELLYCVALVAMTSVHCRTTLTKSTASRRSPKENVSPDRRKPTGPEQSRSLTENIRNITKKIKARQTRRKTTTGNKLNAATSGRSGLTTQRPRPHIQPHPTTPDPSTDYTLDEIFTSDPDFFEKLSRQNEEINAKERRREEVLKAFQANATGRFREWPFPFTESTYIHEYNTLKMDVVKHWKNATRDFTELRREYVKESRSLHVAEMFTAYRRRGTHFYTVLGMEGWDGNIFEYPEVPYKYKDNPGSSYSVKTCEVETRDPRVLKFTEGESRLTISPRYRLGRHGEWVIDFPNEPYISAGPERVQWPYKWREDDPDNATILLKDFPTFARKRRKRNALSTVRMKRKIREPVFSRFEVSDMSKISRSWKFPACSI